MANGRWQIAKRGEDDSQEEGEDGLRFTERAMARA